MITGRGRRSLSVLSCAAIALVAACGDRSAPTAADCIKVVEESGESTDACLPVAAEGERVDLGTPTFSHPTAITNRLHPSSGVEQSIYGGHVDGKPFRTEVTRLPGIRAIRWRGTNVDTVVVQYVAYLDGRINEVALDKFAQADDGSVWYFGEDVSNYADGKVADTEGSWLAADKTPPAMIMPAQPRVGDVYRLALWARQVSIDAAAEEAGFVSADVAALDRVWERTRHAVEPTGAVDAVLQRLREAAEAEDLPAADDAAQALSQAVADAHVR